VAHLLPGARSLKPHQQGDLSRLCGLYSIINAIQLALYPEPLDSNETHRIFTKAVQHLHRKRLLLAACHYGIDEGPWFTLMREMVDQAAAARGASMRITALLSAACISRGRAIVAICRAVERGSPVLVAFGGALDHYTVVCGHSETRLRLFDSLGLRAVAKAGVGLGEGSRRRHRMAADAVYALSRT
jgi:hypothetical protein